MSKIVAADVISKQLGVDRKHFKEQNSTERLFSKRGFQGLLADNFSRIDQLLSSVEISAFYSRMTSNCQHEVSKWHRALAQHSLSLRTVGQINQKYRLKYWATCFSICSFARTAHLLSLRTLLALLMCSTALTRSLAHFAHSLACGTVND